MAKFYRRGTSKIRFLPSVAGSSPTRAEMNAGVDLSVSVTDIAGWQMSNAPISFPVLATTFDEQVIGPDTVADSTLTFIDDDAVTTIRTALAKGTLGYVMLMPYGDVPTKRAEIWQVRSSGVNDEWSMGADPARYVVGFAIQTIPNQAAVIPA